MAQDSTRDDRLVGRIGRVTLPIPAGGPGEVRLEIRGGSERFAAWSDEVLDTPTAVVVVDVRSARSVVVASFPEAETL